MGSLGERSIGAPLAMQTTTDRPRARAPWLVLLAVIVAGGFALRLWLAAGDLWLDEIWSWKFAQAVHGPADVWRIAHDNNHPLNTLWIWLLGPAREALSYRALSLVSGTLAIVLAARVGARDGRFGAVAAASLVASSTLLAYYSAEARGYAPAAACALGGWLALDRARLAPRSAWTLAWWALVALGLASHFTFVFAWGALALDSLFRLRREQSGWRPALARFAALHGVPCLLLALVYFGFVRRMQYGGGDAWTWEGVWLRAACWTLGLPEGTGWALGGSLAVGAALLAQFARARAGRESRIWLYAAIVLAPPLVTAGVLRPDFVALRYFLVPLAFATLLLASALAALWQRRGPARIVAVGLLLVVSGHNLARAVLFARAGRGQFRAALQCMFDAGGAEALRLASDLEFDARLQLEYHLRGLPPGRRITLFDLRRPPAEGLDWLILATPPPGRPERLEWAGHAYRLARSFEAAGPSSYSWTLYRRAQ